VLQCVVVCCRVWCRQSSGINSERVAVCCSVLQCVAVCCSVLPCVAVCCSRFLHRTRLETVVWAAEVRNKFRMCCSVSQCVAECCSVLQCVAVCCSGVGGGGQV